MGIFNNKKQEIELNNSTFNSETVDDFLNKLEDIVCLANYDGTIEKINNSKAHSKYSSLHDIFYANENKEIYNIIIDNVKNNGSFIEDIEITTHQEKTYLYVAAYNISASEKMLFYIRNTTKYFKREPEPLENIYNCQESIDSNNFGITIDNDELQNNILLKNKSTNPKHILLFGTEDARIDYLKNKLIETYEVDITKSESEAQTLLKSGSIDMILIDEFHDLAKEFNFVNSIKCNPNISKLPIILINKNKSSSLKEFESMINLTTNKSKETGEHLRRTKEYMKVILQEYENFYKENIYTSPEIIEDISVAAVLHDIGKIGIPDNILNKPGRLNDEEYEIIKSHVAIGKNILETTYENSISNKILDFAKDIVYHHHEKFDGTGYPEKLKGEEISLNSRIMALIDVYDALANDRVYKKAMPYEEIEEFMKSQSGKSFDPKVVNIFLLVKDELKAINEHYKDKNTIIPAEN